MPRNRSSGRKSSTSNKSEEVENEVQAPQQEQQQSIQAKTKSPQRKLSEIQNQVQSNAEEPKHPEKLQQQLKVDLESLPPNRYSVYRQSFNFSWNMKDFDISKALEEFGQLDCYDDLEDTDEEEFQKEKLKENQNQKNQIKLRIYKSNKETSGLTKKTTYFITGRDKSGPFEISRFYHEFVMLRQKLLLRWPGCFIPPLPTKKFGNSPYELVLIRMKFLNNFLKRLGKNPELYNGQQCQIFFKHEGEYIITNGKLIEQQLQKLKSHSNDELLQKYKEVFSHSVEELTEQEQSIAMTEIKELEEQLKSWKVDLSRFKDQLRSLITIKDKYYQAMTRLSTVLLPEFESVVLDWINDDRFSKKPQLSTEQTKQATEKEGYLLNTQEYGTALKDAALSVMNYNQSLWIIYDIFKFELKQTDAILDSIESYEFLVREMDYLNRNININKDQIESLDEKKTTLKIFMMGGTVDEKKIRINKESETFEQRLAVVKELLNFVLNVLITSIDNFHNDRAETYKRLLAKSSHDQLVLIKKLMDFHLFELETFRKKDYFTSKIQTSTQGEEEIVEE